MKRGTSTKHAALKVLGRPEGGAGGTRPLVVPPARHATLTQQVVTSLHQLIDTLNELSAPSISEMPAAPVPNLPLLLDARETGRLLSVSRSKVLEMAAQGALPSIKVGGSVRIPRDLLTAWIADKTRNADSQSRMRLPAWVHVDRSGER